MPDTGGPSVIPSVGMCPLIKNVLPELTGNIEKLIDWPESNVVVYLYMPVSESKELKTAVPETFETVSEIVPVVP